jgi:hypothetical protein
VRVAREQSAVERGRGAAQPDYPAFFQKHQYRRLERPGSGRIDTAY